MKAPTFYWLLLVLLVVVEFSLIRNAVHLPRWDVRVLLASVAALILAAWYQFERNRREHRIVYIFMLGMLVLATLLTDLVRR